MRAKILFLAQHSDSRQSLRYAQQALSELAIAFSHSFVMREMALSDQMNDSDLRQLIQDHDSVLLASGPEGQKQVINLLNCHSGLRALNPYDVIEDLGRLKADQMPSADLLWPLDETTQVNKAAVTACALAKKSGKPLFMLENETTRDWLDALNKAAMYAALPAPNSRSLESVIESLLYQHDKPPFVLCTASDAKLLSYLLMYMGGSEHLTFDQLLSDTRFILSVQPLDQSKDLPFFALMYALVSLVRESLKLERKADCLETVVTNVLQSGWRTPEFGIGEKTISCDEVMELMSQQIQLAGELFERLG